MLANLFIIGAPKSGTTSVANALGNHHDIFLPHVKEPNFFGSDTGQNITDEAEYTTLYKKAETERYRLDASTLTLSSVDAIECILQRVPDAYFIVLLRDPVEAVPAFHSQLLRHFVEKEIDFATAWAQQNARERGDIDGPLYRPIFDYGRQVERLTRLVSKDKYIIFPFTALKSDGNKVVSDVIDFLDLAPLKLELKKDNSNTEHKFRNLHSLKQRLASKVRRLKIMLGIQKNFGLGKMVFGWNAKAKERKSFAPHIVEELRSKFANDCEKVQAITGIDIRAVPYNNEVPNG